jgi:hypothetical protein
MQMTERHRQRVGRVVWCRRLRQSQQDLDHLLHLVFLGAAVPDDRTLDLGGRILRDWASGLYRGEDRDTARVPELQGAADIRRVEQVFHRDAVRFALR